MTVGELINALESLLSFDFTKGSEVSEYTVVTADTYGRQPVSGVDIDHDRREVTIS